MRLSEPERRADLAGELPCLPGRGEGLLVPVQVGQCNGLVDLQQQPQVGQRRIGLGHLQRPVIQRQRIRRMPASRGHERQHMQEPARGPVIARLRRRLQRGVRDPAGRFEFAEVAVCPRGEHEQPGPVPGRQARSGQRLAECRQRFGGGAGQHPALRSRPVQVHQQIGLGGVLQCAGGHLLGAGPVTDAIEGVGEPAGQPAVPA